MAGGQFLDHVVDATLPVLKICLLGAVGAGLARGGILDQGGRRTLSKLIYCLFTPTLTFTKLAPVLNGQHLLLWMPLVVNMFVSVGAGLLLGGLLLVLVRQPPGLRRHVVVATALGNAGNLPLVLCAALVRETGGKLFGQEVLSEDLAIAYVAMGIWAATVTHFTIGSELLKLPADQQQQHQQQQQNSVQKEDEEHTQQLLLLGGCKQTDSSTGRSWAHAAASAPAGVGGPVGSSEGATASCVVEFGLLPAQQQQQPQQQQPQQQRGQGLSAMQLDSSGSTHSLRSLSHGSADCLVLAGPVVAADSSSSSSKKGGSCDRCGSDMPRAAQGVSWRCPLCGAANKAAAAGDEQQQQQQQEWQHSTAQAQEHVRLLGSAAGAGPDSSDSVWLHAQQQQEEYKGPGFGAGNGNSSSSSRLRRVGQVVWDVGCQLASPPMVGCMLAVVVGLTPPLRDQLFSPGGSLLMVQDCISMFGDCCIPCLLLMLGATLSKGPGQACPPWRVVAAVAAARLVLLPLLGTGWLVLAKTLGWYYAPDKMFVLVMLIQNAVPTALNVHTLATLHSNKEAEMGALLFWQYLAACVTLPAALSCFLWLLNTPAMSS